MFPVRIFINSELAILFFMFREMVTGLIPNFWISRIYDRTVESFPSSVIVPFSTFSKKLLHHDFERLRIILFKVSLFVYK